MSLTTDKNDPSLNKVKDNGQNETYLVLSDEERAKGFIRPVRTAYVHVGRKYKGPLEILDQPYFNEQTKKAYTAIAPVFNSAGKRIGGSYLTAEEVDQWHSTGGYIRGCRTITTMALPLAETYARDPKFYNATFCCGCGTHLPVNEFVWEGTTEPVGS
jgi:hypothetical protein